jgi:hypothetical protein
MILSPLNCNVKVSRYNIVGLGVNQDHPQFDLASAPRPVRWDRRLFGRRPPNK